MSTPKQPIHGNQEEKIFLALILIGFNIVLAMGGGGKLQSPILLSHNKEAMS